MKLTKDSKNLFPLPDMNSFFINLKKVNKIRHCNFVFLAIIKYIKTISVG